MKEFLQVMKERGYLHQCTDEEGLAKSPGPVTAYVGYDCTAPSLHVGSLVSIMMLRWLQKLGGKPIVLMGGGTTKIGDPSGKDTSRQVLTAETIASNMASIRTVFAKFLAEPFEMVNNADWLEKLNYIDFLRDFGPHFTINRMMTFDSVKLRLDREQPLTFLEFNYMILQAYDFLELSKRNGCTLQMGGSDQWGNIVNGIELTRKKAQREVFGLTTALITTASGAKMGKTADGAVWLNADQFKPYDYWQYWRNTEDADVEKFLKLFTELPLDEVKRLAAIKGQEINEAKKVLATEATALLHGREAALAAAATAQATFEQGATAEGLPTIVVPELKEGIALFALVAKAGLAESNSKGRELVRGKGVKLDDVVQADEKYVVKLESGQLKVSAGKKRHVIVKPG
ncbi:MAG: tyrosine--tRNA ligase [Myxococcaceae bacterium]|nr:tyrosine--tRNA ligase [Myxococcaceae bacterium]